jgi:hypothetical protein
MPVRSTPFIFFNGDGPNALFVSRYVVPAGRTAIVHTWILLNHSAVAQQVILAVRRGSTTCRVVQVEQLAAKTSTRLPEPGLVAAAGDELVTFVSRASGTTSEHSVFCSGSLLEGVLT